MTEDKIFADGLIYKAPRDGAPEFVKGSLSVKVPDFIYFLEKHVKPDGWVNIDLKESRGGKLYAELNTWSKGGKAEPAEEMAEEPVDEDAPPF